MKGYTKNRGWLVKCVGGPLDKTFVRTFAGAQDPVKEMELASESFPMLVSHPPYDTPITEWIRDTSGEYRLVRDPSGKMAKTNKQEVPAMQYVWTAFDD